MASPDPSLDSAEPGERRGRLWVGLLLAVLAALLLHGAWAVGPTYDEHFYIASGYAYLQEGDFSLNREHPPLLKMIAGAGLLFFDDLHFPDDWARRVDYPTSFFYRLNAETLDRNLFAARVGLCALTVLAAWVVYRSSRAFFGVAGGLVSLLLFAFNPNVLAHGRLAALDAGTGAFLFLSVVTFAHALRDPRPSTRLVAAVVFGLAQLAKFTALVLVPLYAVVALVCALRERRWRHLGTLAWLYTAGLGVFAAGYGFEAVARNEAWGNPRYVVAGEGAEVSEPSPSALAERLQEADASGALGAAEIGRVRDAAHLENAVLKLVEYAEGDDERGAAARRVLEGLADGEPEARRHAFRALLRGDEESAARRLALLERLARADFADLAAATTWWGRNAGEDWQRRLFYDERLDAALRAVFGGHRPVPLFSALRGIDHQRKHASFGHPTVYRGEVLRAEDFEEGNPHPEYYAVLLLTKNPPFFTLLVLGGLALAFVPRGRWSWLATVLFVGLPAGLFAIFSASKLLLGIKYVLPLLPFGALLAGRVAVRLPRLAVLLAALAALEGIALQPHQLMYSNLFVGGPRGGARISVVGDDWGQDVRRLGAFYRRHRDAIDRTGGLYFEPHVGGDVAAFGLEGAHDLAGNQPEGIVAVQAVARARYPERYAWLEGYEPFLTLGWSIDVYDTRSPAPGGDPLAEWESARNADD